jgi:signal transduction histidine kinase/CheY-like chemotaxis protein
LSWKAASDLARRCIYTVARDITDLKRAEFESQQHAIALSEARGEAERANRAKTEFLSNISHDLRTPLNAILGFAQLLEREPLAVEQQESVRQIIHGGKHLLELISEVIDITRIESGRLSMSLEAVAVHDVVSRAIKMIDPIARARRLSIHVGRIPAGAGLIADRQRIHQVLLNFLSNAVKYNRPGGRVTITVHSMDPDRCRIAVADTGAGLSAEKQALLFQPFERLGAENSSIQGNGLGLALSRNLAQAMGGKVGVHSIVDVGTTVWIELPSADAPAEPPMLVDVPVQAISRAHAASAGTVLYIEDNQANIFLMERILRHRPGLELVTAASGEEGIAVALSRLPSLILLDLHLPDMTGEDVLGRLWEEPAMRDIPCVILTADATPGLGRRLKSAGALAHLTKPLHIQEVLECVDDLLARVPESVSHD